MRMHLLLSALDKRYPSSCHCSSVPGSRICPPPSPEPRVSSLIRPRAVNGLSFTPLHPSRLLAHLSAAELSLLTRPRVCTAGGAVEDAVAVSMHVVCVLIV
jgi:hypothetical protein